MHALAAHAHAGQIAKQPLGLVIRHFRHQLGGRLLHIELCTPRRQAQDLIEGIEAHTASRTIEIRPLQLDRPHQGFDGTPDRITSCQEPRTLGAATLLPGVFTPMSMLDYCLSQATGERLAQVPHRLGHLR